MIQLQTQFSFNQRLGLDKSYLVRKMKSQLVRSPGQLYCEILTFRLHLEPLSKSLQRVVVVVVVVVEAGA